MYHIWIQSYQNRIDKICAEGDNQVKWKRMLAIPPVFHNIYGSLICSSVIVCENAIEICTELKLLSGKG